MTRAVEIRQVDAFTVRPFAGNPAGVVLDADGLSDEQMQRIAAELKAPETGFVAPADQPEADFRLRWFTPSGTEVTFCGHATVAVVHALWETRRISGDRVIFETLGGLLPVTRTETSTGPVIWLEPILPACTFYPQALAPVLDALGVTSDGLADWARPALTPERDLLLPAASLELLKSLSPDNARLARAALDGHLRGVCLTARETVDRESLIHSRFFAPHYGIPEDPVTGSVHASIPVWLWQAGLLSATDDVAAFVAEQGDFLGRPGRLRVELFLSSRHPSRVRVGGQAVTVLSGTIRVE